MENVTKPTPKPATQSAHPDRLSWLFPAVAIAFALLFIFVLLGTPMLSSGISKTNEIKTQVEINDNILSFADQNPNYIFPATIIKIQQHKEYKKYYIEYNFLNSNGVLVTSSTFAMFDKEILDKYSVGDTLQVAVKDPSNKYTKSVPLICKNVSLSNVGQYIQAKQLKTTGMIYLIISAMLFFFILAGFILIYHHMRRQDGYTSLQRADNEVVIPSGTGSFCKHCGAHVPPYKQYCDNCGRKVSHSKSEK